VFSKDIGGGEFFQLYRYDFSTGDTTLLTDGKSRNTDPVWSYAGDKLAYGSTRRTGNDVDLYVIDPANPKSDHLLAQLNGGGWTALDWSPDGRSILVSELISAQESYLWTVDANSGTKTLITAKGARTRSLTVPDVSAKTERAFTLRLTRLRISAAHLYRFERQATYLPQQRHPMGCGGI